ncbi:MAG: DUF885 domain-containing protein [Bdellovibrionales bacterium]|nr:DUF885 domain-containing protein [Bdellovibrionales bacterium]
MKKIITILAGCVLISCASATNSSNEVKISENQKLDQFFEKTFNFWVQRSPEFQSYLGIKDDYDRLDDISEERKKEDLEYTKKFLKELLKFNYAKLDESHKMSFDIFKQRSENSIADYKYRYYGYSLNQMFGVQSELPSFMINFHTISDYKDAKAYISRLKLIKQKFSQLLVRLTKSQEMGIVPPKFVFPHVIRDSENMVTGQPFTNDKEDSPLFADFKKKVEGLKLSLQQKADLKEEARQVLIGFVKPAYQKLINFVKNQEKIADHRAGVWKFPEGDNYYKNRLERYTTTQLNPEEIHQLGLSEVKRIHGEMQKITKRVGYKGSLNQFFNFIKNDKKFYYKDTLASREKYLSDTSKIISEIKTQLPKMFNVQAKADLIVKPVEAFREKSAGKAFYQGPPMEGNRPGVYYVNLYDMSNVANFEMEALAYHEAIPGHHMQVSIAREQKDLPKFRRYAGYAAYSEGWGLYAELLPKEFGFYKDPYSDFGRLSMELLRAGRLVVDTGLHFKRWTREQAITYLDENTPTDHQENIKAIERYIVMPGQATAYKVGMLKILQLRSLARQQLKEDFDIREFHDKVLSTGALPLNLLEKIVVQWVNEKSPLNKRPASL